MFNSQNDNRKKVDRLLTCNLLVGSVACFCIAACTVGPDYHSPVMNMPKSFVATSPEGQKPAEDTGNKPVIDAAKWWQALGDEELNSLIDRAILNNPDIEIALDRMQEARTAEIVVMGEALPEAECRRRRGPWHRKQHFPRPRGPATCRCHQHHRG